MGKWFSELKVVHKLMLMSIFFLLPDTLMLCMVFKGINENLRFAEQERRGNSYLHPLVNLLHELPEHQRLANLSAAGDSIATGSLAAATAKIQQSLLDLDQVDQQYAGDLQFNDEALAHRGRAGARPGTLRVAWAKLRANPTRPDSAIYDQMLATVRVMITHAGDMSNLILDPDLDTYYLTDAVLLSLPPEQDQLTSTIDDGESFLASAGADHSSDPIAAMQAGILKDSDRDHIVNDVNTSLREDSVYYGTSQELQRQMPSVRDAYFRAMTRFIDLTESLGKPGTARPTPAEYRQAGTEARDAGYALWEVSSTQLDIMLKLRIGYFQHRRLTSVGITAMAVLAATLLVTFINRSINRPILKQAQSLRDLNAALNAEVRHRIEVQAALLDASHRAGMAEIATGVLHNVGNVLNSVNTSAAVIREKLQLSRVPILGKAAVMIQEHRASAAPFFTTDAKGKMIPDLLSRLAEAMESDRSVLQQEIEQLSRNVEHINQIVVAQQSFARGGAACEDVNLADLIEDALRINSLKNGADGIELIRDFQTLEPARISKHKVLQILVNLISNAKKAVLATESPIRRITISLSASDGDASEMARIRVVDTGVGIAPENLKKIFQHGFTTRKDGHGFGLHTAANDANAMGGSVTVSSPGTGAGATFTLNIPMAQAELVQV